MLEWWADVEPWAQLIITLGMVVAAVSAIWRYIGHRIWRSIVGAVGLVVSAAKRIEEWNDVVRRIPNIEESLCDVRETVWERIPNIEESLADVRGTVREQLKPNGGTSMHDQVERIEEEVTGLRDSQEEIKEAKERDNAEIRERIEGLTRSQMVLARLIRTEDDD